MEASYLLIQDRQKVKRTMETKMKMKMKKLDIAKLKQAHEQK